MMHKQRCLLLTHPILEARLDDLITNSFISPHVHGDAVFAQPILMYSRYLKASDKLDLCKSSHPGAAADAIQAFECVMFPPCTFSPHTDRYDC